MSVATAWAPGSVGNVGPGFDVLGLAVDGVGDRVTVELTRDTAPAEVEVRGRDAAFVPREAARNCAAIAANAMLRDDGSYAVVTLEKGLALSGGMGGSAASSVAGAYAAWRAMQRRDGLSDPAPIRALVAAALEGESAVAGRHLDNIASSLLGGLTLSRNIETLDIVRLHVAASWFVALVTPHVRVETRAARALLPKETPRTTWIEEMANTAALVHAFATADEELLRRALDDVYAEPHRASLIPHFRAVKSAALDNGALGCSISGAGPTVFAIASTRAAAETCAHAMQRAFDDVPSTIHVGAIATEGVREI